MVSAGIRSKARCLAIVLPVAILACSWAGTAFAGDPSTGPLPGRGVNLETPALDPRTLDGESAGTAWSMPASPAATQPNGPTAIILWDELKRGRQPSGPQNGTGVSMVNGNRQ